MPESSIWSKSITTANKNYDEWENKFKCKDLEKYYEGFHWTNAPSNYNPYTINEIYSIIKVKMATYLVSRPKFLISPEPADGEYDLERAIQGAQTKEDIINTIIKRHYISFNRQVKLAFLDSVFRFGIMEVGYSSDWVKNPNADKPLLKSHISDNVYKDKIVREPDELPANERIYFRRIPAKRFRIGGIDQDSLTNCNWVGYYDFVYKSDLFVDKDLKIDKKEFDLVTPLRTNDFLDYLDPDTDILKGGNVVKIWRIWDNRAKESIILLDSPMITLQRKHFNNLPLFDIRWDLRTIGWYPIPLAFQWISPQDEINEAAEQLRNFRKRFTRKFQTVKDGVDETEKSKFEYGPEGSLVEVNRDEAIKPIQNPEISASVRDAFIISSDTLNKISGTSSEQRGQADRTTATQARLIDIRSTIRESAEQVIISDWMCAIARETLSIVKERFIYGVWADTSNQDQLFGSVSIGNKNEYILPEQIDNYDYTIQIDVTSASPIRAEEDKKKFLEFLAVVSNFPQIALSPNLIREAAYRCGYRNEKVIKEMQNMALITTMGQMAGQLPGAEGGQKAQQITEQATPNTQAEIENQLGGQLLT